MRTKTVALAMLIAGSVQGASVAVADTVVVPGTANPFYSGRSDTGEDGTVPPQSTLTMIPGATLTFKVKGGASNTPDCCFPLDGNGADDSMQYLDPTTGIAGLDHEPDGALVGVFLTDKAPKPPAPARMNLAVTGLDFKKLKPHIAQVFFIGDGRTGLGMGKHQRFIVPKGATRLFLAVSDGFGWYNNSGQITATITQTAP